MKPLESVFLHPGRSAGFRPSEKIERRADAKHERWTERRGVSMHPKLLPGSAESAPHDVGSGLVDVFDGVVVIASETGGIGAYDMRSRKTFHEVQAKRGVHLVTRAE